MIVGDRCRGSSPAIVSGSWSEIYRLGFIVPGLLGWAISLPAFCVVAYLLGFVGMGNEDLCLVRI
jgi:hypothetical protein